MENLLGACTYARTQFTRAFKKMTQTSLSRYHSDYAEGLNSATKERREAKLSVFVCLYEGERAREKEKEGTKSMKRNRDTNKETKRDKCGERRKENGQNER